ncbi:MAG TPA: universal stress protein [Gemmatimonadales bacterium]
MFRSILVPLDGSAMAEQALVPAGDIARRVGAAVALAVVHPWGPTEDAPFSGTEADRELREVEERYLHELRERVAATFNVPAEVTLLEGDAAPALAAYARERRVDLVVGSTHGRGAFARALQGGVALRLAHALPCPALLLKPLKEASTTPDPDGFTRIMVPLDGTPAAETSLEPALALAASRGVVVYLLQVVTPLGGAPLVDRRREAVRYLNGVASRLEGGGMRVECRVMTRANPGAGIATLAGRWGIDLLAITTRERGEGERLLLGSVADTAVRLAAMPVLVCHSGVRARAAEPVRGEGVSWLVPPLPSPA